MKLTNQMRKEFVNAVMADVPFVDYLQMIEDEYNKDFYNEAPEIIKHIFDDVNLRDQYFTKKSMFQTLNTCGLVEVYDSEEKSAGHIYVYKNNNKNITLITEAIVINLLKAWEKQYIERCELRAKLKGAVAGIPTTQDLIKLLPEFAKYVPKEPEKEKKHLPVTTDLLASLTKAGWKLEARTA